MRDNVPIPWGVGYTVKISEWRLLSTARQPYNKFTVDVTRSGLLMSQQVDCCMSVADQSQSININGDPVRRQNFSTVAEIMAWLLKFQGSYLRPLD